MAYMLLLIAGLAAAPALDAKPGSTFRECADCPEMIVVPAGRFTIGSPRSEPGRGADEGPQPDRELAKGWNGGLAAHATASPPQQLGPQHDRPPGRVASMVAEAT